MPSPPPHPPHPAPSKPLGVSHDSAHPAPSFPVRGKVHPRSVSVTKQATFIFQSPYPPPFATNIMPAFIPCLAEANIWANLGVLLLIGGFILIGKLMDYLKGKFEQATKKSAESPAERKIRKVIEQSRTRQPGNYRKQGQPEHPMHRQHVPAVSPKQQDAYSTPGAIPPLLQETSPTVKNRLPPPFNRSPMRNRKLSRVSKTNMLPPRRQNIRRSTTPANPLPHQPRIYGTT